MRAAIFLLIQQINAGLVGLHGAAVRGGVLQDLLGRAKVKSFRRLKGNRLFCVEAGHQDLLLVIFSCVSVQGR